MFYREKNEPDTVSELGFSMDRQINVLTLYKFSYNRKDCSKEFMKDDYITFRKWFFKEFSSEKQQMFKKQFYDYIDENEKVIPFVEWFYDHYDHDYPSVCTIDEFYKTWKTISGKEVKSLHPPTEALKIDFENNQILETNAFHGILDIYHAPRFK